MGKKGKVLLAMVNCMVEGKVGWRRTTRINWWVLVFSAEEGASRKKVVKIFKLGKKMGIEFKDEDKGEKVIQWMEDRTIAVH